MRKKIACLLAAALCVTAALGGCSGSGKGSGGDASSSDGSGGTFIVRSAGDPMSFNPDVAGDVQMVIRSLRICSGGCVR